jgi:cellulose synthase/poly-beta-1,6-N-acetylglucosamine synthase-like glycosyltransferase
LEALAKASALTCATIGALATSHLLGLLLSALRVEKKWRTERSSSVRFAVVIPAHDEQTQIARTVKSIEACTYPPERRRIVVVADNCTDRTPDAARAAGAEVWQPRDPSRRGKGYALEWAFSRLMQDPAIDAVCVIDADCEVSENLLLALAARLTAGAEVVQTAYFISNPDDSAAAALRWAGFGLFNFVRPLGRHGLGLSSGLLGTGMAFSRGLLLRSPWSAFSYAEDREQHMQWVLGGARVEFAPDARVVSPAPNLVAIGKTQAARWDSGRRDLATRVTPKLLMRWRETGELAALDAAIEPLLPPQSLLVAINLTAVLAARFARARVLAHMATATALGQVVYVLGGLAALHAPGAVWRALLTTPQFAFRRLRGLVGQLVGCRPSGWERTRREGAARG